MKNWTMAELEPDLSRVSSQRSYAQAQQSLLAANCLGCHRVGDRGAQIGPDLLAQPPGDIHGWAEEAIGAGGVHEQMAVVVTVFDEWRIRQGTLQQCAHRLLITVGVGRQNAGIPAPAHRMPQSHAFANTGQICFLAHIVNRSTRRAFGRNDDRPVLQPAVHGPFHGHGKVSHVQVDDGAVEGIDVIRRLG